MRKFNIGDKVRIVTRFESRPGISWNPMMDCTIGESFTVVGHSEYGGIPAYTLNTKEHCRKRYKHTSEWNIFNFVYLETVLISEKEYKYPNWKKINNNFK